MNFATLNKNYEKDLEGFTKEFKSFLKIRKIKMLTFFTLIGIFIGISVTLYLLNELIIDNLTFSLYAIVISLFIGFASLLVAWDSQRRGDFGMKYSELRFNYIMQYIKVVDDKLP
jgi:hypothetical protein